MFTIHAERDERFTDGIEPEFILTTDKPAEGHERAMFGAGCFWGVEETFRATPGVSKTGVGYSGGAQVRPTYREVCTSNTGHAEVVYVEFDPAVVSYETLLGVFFSNHNPTQLNRQGPDVGTQYRSAVFYYDEAQRVSAEKVKAELQASGKFQKEIVTEISAAPTFWRAEEYHQKYLAKRGQSSCHI
jgi:peptide-methionine (S)-S-oxide reductase